MKLLGIWKRWKKEPPIPKSEKAFYQPDSYYADLMACLKSQDDQIAEIQKAEKEFENTGDIGTLIEFWENLWANGGLKFNGSRWTFRLADLYIQTQQYDDALRAIKMIKNPAYKEKKAKYIEKIEKLSAKKKSSQSCKTV